MSQNGKSISESKCARTMRQRSTSIERQNQQQMLARIIGVWWNKPHMLLFTDLRFLFFYSEFCFHSVSFLHYRSVEHKCVRIWIVLLSRFHFAINQQGMHWMQMPSLSPNAEKKSQVPCVMTFLPFNCYYSYHIFMFISAFCRFFSSMSSSFLFLEPVRVFVIPIIYGESVRMNRIEKQIQIRSLARTQGGGGNRSINASREFIQCHRKTECTGWKNMHTHSNP